MLSLISTIFYRFKCGMALIFHGSLILQISQIWNRLWNYFSENFDTSKFGHICDVKDGSISVLQEGGWTLSRDWLTWIYKECSRKKYHRLRYPQQTQKLQLLLQPSASSAKAVRGMYLKISAEKKAEIGQHAAGNSLIVGVIFEWHAFTKQNFKQQLFAIRSQTPECQLCRPKHMLLAIGCLASNHWGLHSGELRNG